ncbi:hypothetical protein [Sphingobacterium bambusae]|uniref:Ribosome alternative rescue factor ArfA n=1 Tax=Sphingobacterium bambusae TaxID=662858 RepID=A0ABW6BIK2_9SPHI|nr:hypothetical protein [Sphingobacterium bambusae]WPL49783.1 hypothetical protein SCB77_04860 [Sphingobacterium bambusae]
MKDRLKEPQFNKQETISAALGGRKRQDGKLKKVKPNKADVWKSGYFFPHLPIGFFL